MLPDPDVVVVLVDTLRADHMSLYGYPRQTSTNIDHIARQGVTFDNAIGDRIVDFALQRFAAYRTISPRTLGGDRCPDGCAVRDLVRSNEGPWVSNRRVLRESLLFHPSGGFDRGFIHFDDYFYSVGDMFYRTLWGRILNRYVSDRLGWDEIRQCQEGRGRQRRDVALGRWRSGKPFFAFLNYFDVHTPYLPPPAYRGKFTSATAALQHG